MIVLPSFFSLLGSQSALAQAPNYTYVDGSSLRVFGMAATVPQGQYRRLPQEQLSALPERLQQLALNTAGIHLDFRTDSRSISVKWELDEFRELYNMTPVAVNGLDLYGYRDGQWQFVAVARPVGRKNSSVLIRNLDGQLRNYRLYLPLYTGVKKLQLGVEEGSRITKSDPALIPSSRVLIYGSSITQGASASRSGMAFPAILSRELNAEFLNFGFSGSGKMEPEVAEFLGSLKADVIVLDCVANPSPQQIRERTLPFVKLLRQARPEVPIVMLEAVIREKAHWDLQWQERATAQNKAFRETYEQLTQMGVENLFYIPSEGFTGTDHEATIDGTHFTDLGHFRMATALKPILEKILGSQEIQVQNQKQQKNLQWPPQLQQQE